MIPSLSTEPNAETALDIEALSRHLGCELALIITLVDEGVLEPQGPAPAVWRFNGSCQQRAWRAVRLLRDLELSPPGVALAMQLLDEISRLEAQLSEAGHVAT